MGGASAILLVNWDDYGGDDDGVETLVTMRMMYGVNVTESQCRPRSCVDESADMAKLRIQTHP